jgi:hypothetical protein
VAWVCSVAQGLVLIHHQVLLEIIVSELTLNHSYVCQLLVQVRIELTPYLINIHFGSDRFQFLLEIIVLERDLKHIMCLHNVQVWIDTIFEQYQSLIYKVRLSFHPDNHKSNINLILIILSKAKYWWSQMRFQTFKIDRCNKTKIIRYSRIFFYHII